MVEQIVTIQNRAGIHARPSAMLVQTAKDFKSNIYLEKGNDRINGKSIMGILTLGASYGTEIKVIVEGEDEQLALEAMVNLFNKKFEEE
ncbi:HPr family phosphocarrier protein [Treponema primitia]|uniref:HPr family phosphocarrier protein n=1 Tax=Treponema primitia TaxID=88058 RepID=UPI00025551CF|nr:HPr family phosphocarrier protein [Treponema primitia]